MRNQTSGPAGQVPAGPRPARRLALFGGVVVLGVLVGLLLEEIYRGGLTAAPPAARPAPVAAAPAAAARSSAFPRAAARPPTPAPEPPAAAPPAPAAVPAAPVGPTPPHHIPAWAVRPGPAPVPVVAEPPELPDPTLPRPVHNPGGVNGDRPPRPVPGAE